MDGGNGFHAAKYGGGRAQDATIMNRIMLRFRPIAPKPVANGSSSQEPNNMEVLSKKRVKRKYVRVKRNTKNKDNKEDGEDEKCNKDGSVNSDDNGGVLTLQLMPESTSTSSNGVKNFLESGSLDVSAQQQPPQPQPAPAWSEFLAVGSSDRRVVESWVMVDRLTNTFVDFEILGCTDVEKMRNLEADTCPGLISEGFDKVKWVNMAYRRMVDPLGDGEAAAELVTWLIVKERIILPSNLPAFACTVRILYTWRNAKYTQTMPCDVWKMDFGGLFAWRFDAKAALSLGR